MVAASALASVGTADVAAGKARVPELEVEKLQQVFDAAQKNTRLIVALSPTSARCLAGASAVEAMLRRHPGARVQVFLVWEGVSEKDKKGGREGAYAKVKDARVVQYWDPKLEFSKRMVAEALERPELLRGVENVTKNMIIWDVVTVYPRGVRWQGNLPVPQYYGRSVVDRIGDVENLVAAGK